jgi:hypothetical protein
MFANLPSLEWLDLRYNQLSTLDVTLLTALPKLLAIPMHHNPLRCDCKLKEWVQKFKDHNVWTGYGEVRLKCDAESELGGNGVEGGWGLGKEMCKGDSKPNFLDNYTSEINLKQFQIWDIDTDIKQPNLVPSSLKRYQLPVLSVPVTFGTAFNAILLIIIVCNKEMRNVPNMYILNAAVSDIIYLTVLFSEACANRISDTRVEGEFMCTFLPLAVVCQSVGQRTLHLCLAFKGTEQ